jgi:hypothetical protein
MLSMGMPEGIVHLRISRRIEQTHSLIIGFHKVHPIREALRLSLEEVKETERWVSDLKEEAMGIGKN